MPQKQRTQDEIYKELTEDVEEFEKTVPARRQVDNIELDESDEEVLSDIYE